MKKGDIVIVLAGEDKGKEGKVLAADPKKNRAVVECVNMRKKHTKPSAGNPQGGIVEKEASIDLSNLNLKDPKTGKPTRVKIVSEDGKKVRVSKKSGEEIK